MIKKFFPIFHNHQGMCFLDNAATTHKPYEVVDAISNAYSHNYGNAGKGDYQLSKNASNLYDNCKLLASQFVHASSPEEVVFTGGCTSSINILAFSLEGYFSPSDEILISEAEHNANLLPWINLAVKIGIKIRYLPLSDAITNNLEPYLNDSTKMLCLAHVVNSVGYILPISSIIKKIRLQCQKRVLVLVDGTQSIPCMPINVVQQDCDIFVCSGHKFYGPDNSGITYLKRDIHDIISCGKIGGSTISDLSSIKDFYSQNSSELNISQKLEGGSVDLSGICGLTAAMKFLKEHYPFLKNKYSSLYNYAAAQLKDLGFEVFGAKDDYPKSHAILSVYHNQIHAQDLSLMLAQEKICVRADKFCNHIFFDQSPDMNTGLLRISFGVYNDEQDVQKCIHSIARCLDMLQM